MTIDPTLMIERGMFPENLPSVFTANDLMFILTMLEGHYELVSGDSGDLCTYNASKRGGGQRRIFGMPHPVFTYNQAVFFRDHWTDIEKILQQSPGSASLPIVEINSPRHVRITPHSELATLRLKRLSRFRFCLITDISRFFYSVYTHTFPWAINGKEKAKNDFNPKSPTVFGNWLDFVTRQAQLRQTIGIPVGPDTSRLISEVLMCAVDSRFLEQSAPVVPVYIRHVEIIGLEETLRRNVKSTFRT